MTANIVNFPTWRKNATPVEKLEEVLQYAQAHPEDVKSMVVVWVDGDGEPMWGMSGAQMNYETVGMLEIVKLKILGAHTHEVEE